MSAPLIIFFVGGEIQIDGVLHEDGISAFVIPGDGCGSILPILGVHDADIYVAIRKIDKKERAKKGRWVLLRFWINGK